MLSAFRILYYWVINLLHIDIHTEAALGYQWMCSENCLKYCDILGNNFGAIQYIVIYFFFDKCMVNILAIVLVYRHWVCELPCLLFSSKVIVNYCQSQRRVCHNNVCLYWLYLRGLNRKCYYYYNWYRISYWLNGSWLILLSLPQRMSSRMRFADIVFHFNAMRKNVFQTHR